MVGVGRGCKVRRRRTFSRRSTKTLTTSDERWRDLTGIFLEDEAVAKKKAKAAKPAKKAAKKKKK